MLIFAGVDGTGATPLARFDAGYTPVYQNSHVSKLSRYACWADKTQYDRGPGLLGIETGGLAHSAVNHVVRYWDSSVSKVFLAGFSRGAAAVIESAKILKGYGIPVECLILFDPVDRSYVGGVGGWSLLSGSDTPIVSTVKHCIKVLRHPASASRESFGNCGSRFESPNTKIYPLLVPATHGGVGGTPWPESFVPPGSIYIDEGMVKNNPLGIDIGYEPHEIDGMTRVTPAQDRAGSAASWSFVTGILSPIIDQAMLDAGDATAPRRSENMVPGRTEARALHIVKPGESLSLIALKYYGSFNRWGDIYQANLSTIGSNPNLIQPNMELVIPV
ncbi:MAG: LysM peptidoglycan-binding domain-containing protein [Acidobacteria bacterium]|nr:LysM peptidoglycan-binding domain-containing protein [Acidobacteriota bacterium]